MKKTYQEYINEGHESGAIMSAQGFTAIAQGLPSIAVNELVQTESGAQAIVNSLYEDTVELLMIDRGSASKGEPLVAINQILSVPCGPSLKGRMISPLGEPLDGKEELTDVQMMPLENEAPPIYKRSKIRDQLITGIMLSDLLVPLGRGQREVVMGDAKSGKTSFLLPILMHAKEENMVGVYVGIGKTRSELRRIATQLIDNNPGSDIVVVGTSSSDSVTMQYLAPYAGMTMAEYFRDQGQDVFLVLDDLGNHAKAYREISLLNNRLPGRDSYPGDIFYAHSRLLERGGCVVGPQGQPNTITLMPIIETIGGDVTGYVQTNLISMSDGHTLFDLETFYKGIRPAINIGLSVSRVGKQTQTKLQKFVASELRVMIAQYQDAKNFVRFGAELTDKTKLLFLRGTIFDELIKQDLSTHLKRHEQLLVMLALLDGFYDPFPLKEILQVRKKLLEIFAQSQYEQLRQALLDSADPEVRQPLLDAIYKEVAQAYGLKDGTASPVAASTQAQLGRGQDATTPELEGGTSTSADTMQPQSPSSSSSSSSPSPSPSPSSSSEGGTK